MTAGERIALVGANGSGKTTLLNTMLGRNAPDSGTAQLGSSVIVGEIGQARDELVGAGDVTLLRAFQDVTGMDAEDARTLLAKFGLVADHVLRTPATLSPGERTRASLAVLMARQTNLLVLDEPTNHLDLPAIEQLEVALDAFGGTVVLVTHDRSLLERVNAHPAHRARQRPASSATTPSLTVGLIAQRSEALVAADPLRVGKVAEQRRLEVRHERVDAVVVAARSGPASRRHELERRLELGEVAGLDEHLELGARRRSRACGGAAATTRSVPCCCSAPR